MIVKTYVPIRYRGRDYQPGEILNAGWKLGPGLVKAGKAVRVRDIKPSRRSTEFTVRQARLIMAKMSDAEKQEFAKDDKRKTVQKELKQESTTKELKNEYATK